MKIEWTFEKDLMSQRAFSHEIPVVRLSEVEMLLREAVWAMEFLNQFVRVKEHRDRIQAFLATVAEWRKREEKTTKGNIDASR
jgi:hypothetical protein